MDKKYTGEKIIIAVIPNTHWDPEWYSTYQEYRIRLVRLVDSLLECLRTCRGYKFTFDGQVSALCDYLEIRPEREAEIRRYVQNKRLAIGPWFIIPELFCISGETHIRNLMLGRRIGNRLGGVLPAGFLPDVPGFPAQLPQVLRGAGFDSAVGSRGVAGYPATHKREFLWQAPDGSAVLFIRGSDTLEQTLDASKKDVAGLFRAIAGRFKKETLSGVILCNDGADHRPPEPETPAIVRRAAAACPELCVRLVTMAEYIELVKRRAGNLPVHRGELRSPKGASFFPSGIPACRMSIKQRQFEGEILLERWLEPWTAFGRLLGHDALPAVTARAWRYFLVNSFHDTIYGGHIDRVTPDAMARYKAAAEIAAWRTAEALFDVSRHLDTRGGASALVCFNATSRRRDDPVRAEIAFPAQDNVRHFSITDPSGAPIPFQLLGRQPRWTKLTSVKGIVDRSSPEIVADTFQILTRANIPAWGCAVLGVHPAARWPALPATDLRVGADWAENEHLRLDLRRGRVDLFHKAGGHWFRDLLAIEEQGDIGDHYTFVPPENDVKITSRRRPFAVRRMYAGPVEAAFELRLDLAAPARAARGEKGRSRARVRMPARIILRLACGGRRLEGEILLDNRARDHRVRLLVATGLAGRYADADGMFYVDRRLRVSPVKKPAVPDEYSLHVARAFISVKSGDIGFSLLKSGLPQYQAYPDGTLALTLLRGVSYMHKGYLPKSRDMLKKLNIPFPATFQYGRSPTPGAQELGRHRFAFALYPHQGNWVDAAAMAEARRHQVAARALHTDAHQGELPPGACFLSLEPPAVEVSAIKPADNHAGLIVRCYNLLPRPVTARLRFGFAVRRAQRTDLLERPVGRAGQTSVSGRTVKLRLRGHEIATLAVDSSAPSA